MKTISFDASLHLGSVMYLARASRPERSASMPDEPDFIQATDRLLELLKAEGIPHVLVGGLAMRVYVAARNTEDLDLILAAADLPRVTGLQVVEQTDWFVAARYGPLKVDFLLTRNVFFEEVRQLHTEEHDFQGHRVRCATPLGLILLKLYALPSLYRQGQIDRADLYETDITMLLRAYPHDDSTIMATLARHFADHDVYAIGEVLTDIRGRLKPRF